MNKTQNSGSKKVRFFEKLVRFVHWCDSHGIFKLLADFVLKIVYWCIINRYQNKISPATLM